MKKKVGLISRISLMVALLFTAIGFSFIGNSKKVEPKVAQAYTWEEGYGVKDNSNIILSVTKVAVKSTGEGESLYGNLLDEKSEVAYTNGSYYFYRDIPDLNNDYHKTLISDGSFVKLNNEKVENKYVTDDKYYNYIKADGVKADNITSGNYYKIIETNGVADMEVATTYDAKETYYVLEEVEVGLEKTTIDSSEYTGNETNYFKVVNGEMVQCTADDSYSPTATYYKEKDTAEENIPMQEAILITFGQEEFGGELYYPIQNLYVDIEHNGQPMTVPAARSEGYKRDFGFVIGQDNNNEGHYKITVRKEYYNQSGVQATEDLVFEFYIINDTTYSGYHESNSNRYYSTPSLKLADGGEIAQTAGVHVYNQGNTSKEFPVLTYDYTLYKMSYTHTIDGATAKYDYTYEPDLNQISIQKEYKNQLSTLEPIDVKKNDYSNILVMLFSELGDYEFSFDYIYSGYPYPTTTEKYMVINNINENLQRIKLDIKGFEVNFSKKDYYGGAEMRYFTFNNKDTVYLKVVDGYEKRNAPTGVESLGIIYDFGAQNSLRTGEVVNYQDVNVLSQINQVSDYTSLYTNILSSPSSIRDILSGIKYETTDQNPVKLKSNVDYVKFDKDEAGTTSTTTLTDNQGSFYVYSANEKIKETDIFKNGDTDIDDTQYDLVDRADEKDFGKYFVKQNDTYIKASTIGTYNPTTSYYTMDKNYVARYTSDTSFNNAGYYLVFLAIKGENNQFSHYQVIAFNNLLPDVSMQTEENKTGGIKSPTFTKEKVKLTWEEPDTFEMGLTVRYYYKEYTNTFDHIYTDDELQATTPIYVQSIDITKNGNTNWCVIGNEIDEGESGRYLVIISNEKGNEWTTSFTIDKQDISGINGYGVYGTSGNLLLDENTALGFISNTIQGEFGVTLSWNDKPSGAKITAKYQSISFVQGSEVKEIVDGGISTNFKTNDAIDGSFDITKPDVGGVSEDNVLYDQGIYLFSLIDEAGNEAKYLLILDNTQTFFKVTKEENKPIPDSDYTETVYTTAEWLQYNDVKLTIKAPRYKMIALDGTTKENIMEFVESIADNSLSVLFQGDYIQVKQEELAKYDNEGNPNRISQINDSGINMSLYIKSANENTKIVKDGVLGREVEVNETGTSVIRTYYMRGENQKYLPENPPHEIKASNSYVKVEINPDNSKGYIFFSNSKLTEYPTNEEEVKNKRLTTTTKLSTAHMTNDAFVLFTWIMDIGGKYEVGKVEYDYYPLNLTKEFNSNYYFFDESNKTNKVIYSKKDGISLTSDQIIEENGRGFVTINVENGMTQPGYYVVTRTYDDSVVLGDDSNDVMTLKYHFILDRNGIISMVDGTKVGDYIHIGLLENKTEFKTFDQHTSTTPKKFIANGQIIDYNPSLETNKLPAVVNIPLGKYVINTGEYSNYYAGRLDFTMYFVDYFNQLGENDISKGEDGILHYTIFSAQGAEDKIDKTMINGEKVYFYSLNIKDYIDGLKNGSNGDNWKAVERNFFVRNGTNNDWLSLPGHYVIVIKDRAEGTSGATTETIAFEIKPAQKPETPVFVTPNDTYTTDSVGKSNITSSQQYIKVEFPVYNENNTNAQIYSVEYNGITYTNDSSETSTFKKNGNKWILIIDTMKDNKVYEGQGQYKFVVRYKLGDGNEYQNCYYAYDEEGKEKSYYENTYTVTIDRTAPQQNVNALIGADNIAMKYWGGYSLFEQAFYDNRDNKTTTYFVNRYTKYYDEKSLENIFPFVVNSGTTFNSDDVVEVRYKEFDTTSGVLNLPAVNLTGYTPATSYSKYSDFLTDSKYYEILEIDAAGNITQYVVLYFLTEDDYNDFKILFKATTVKGYEDLSITIKQGTDFKTLIGEKVEESILSFAEESSTTMPYDKLFVMEIRKNGTKISTTLTNLHKADLDKTLLDVLKEHGHGNYNVYIHSRNYLDQVGIQINYVAKVPEFEINTIVEKKNDKTYLNLAAANITEDGIVYYISTVGYKKIGESEFIEFTYAENQYKDKDGNFILGNRLGPLPDGEYILLTEDMFGRKRIYTFSTEYDATEEIIGTFDKVGDVYYSFDALTIKHAEGLYHREIKYTVDGTTHTISSSTELATYSVSGPILFDGKTTQDGYRYLKLYPYIPTDSNMDGKLVNITVRLYTDEIEGLEPQEIIYSICFDTRTGVAYLTDTKNGLEQNMNLFYNQDNSVWMNTSMTSGTMNLTWQNNPSNNFNLKYFLHEKIDDSEKGWLEPIDLTEDQDKLFVIKTKEDNKGLYAFEVQVWSKDNEIYLGNRTYVFMVKSETLQLYTVQSQTREYDPCSTLYKADLFEGESNRVNALKELAQTLGLTGPEDIPNEIKLYITNEASLEVIEDRGQGAEELLYSKTYGDYVLKIHRVYTTSYSQFLATLKVPESSTLIEKDTLKVNGEAITKGPAFEGVNGIELSFTQKLPANVKIAKKNSIRMEVWFNDEIVENYFAPDTGSIIRYQIKGSGLYTFKIYDLSGNCHVFENDIDSFDIYALFNNEVAVLMNEKAVIENGYFSEAVKVSIVNDALYEKIEVSAKREGKPYEYGKNKQTYTFTEAGTYRVIINATYEKITLSKILIFTIINPEVATKSLNLNILEKYELVSIYNGGDLVTDIFKDILSDSKKGNFITYEDIKNEIGSGIFNGKQKFTLTYRVNDGIYPERTQSFSFSLSNDNPAIKCSLKPGETDNNEFVVTYNAGLIYEEIGESTLFILKNGEVVEQIVIKDKPEIKIDNLVIKQKKYGSGDYNIRLVGGKFVDENILYSQNVKLKAPLNASSIIIIIVVSAVVAAGVITFILLRRKMRIR